MNFNNTETLEYLDENETHCKIRRGIKSDCKEVTRLIQELANFQKIPDGPKINTKTLEIDGFDTFPPLYNLFVAEIPEDVKEKSSNQLVAYAVYYNKYSTWTGKAMVLEDLYCTPEYRKKHVGSALFKAVVKEAVRTGCNQLDFEVLEWNPARKFYEKFGAINITKKDSWHMYRMTKEILEAVK